MFGQLAAAGVKHHDGGCRLKFAAAGNSLRIAGSAAAASAPYFGGTISVMRFKISGERGSGWSGLNCPAVGLTRRFILRTCRLGASQFVLNDE
jgi:hypothetical protein